MNVQIPAYRNKNNGQQVSSQELPSGRISYFTLIFHPTWI